MTDFNQQHQLAQQHSKSIEAILHASETPITAKQLCHWLSINPNQLSMALTVLQQRLSQGALTLADTASGYRLQIANDFSPLIQQVFPQRQETLSQALLETLSVIAYKQPVTRGDIEEIRGVAVNTNVVKTLEERGWIDVVGHRETPGRPALFATTKQFLDDLGLRSVSELPPLEQISQTLELNNEI